MLAASTVLTITVTKISLMKNPEFQAAIKLLRLPEKAIVVADTWIYGLLPPSASLDGFPLTILTLLSTTGADSHVESTRLIPFMVYARLSPEVSSNHCKSPQGCTHLGAAQCT